MEVPLAQGAVRGAEDGGCLRFMGIPFVSTCLASGGRALGGVRTVGQAAGTD